MRTVIMVKCNDKIRTYKDADRALAHADARDYGSEVEEYRVLSDQTFERVQ